MASSGAAMAQPPMTSSRACGASGSATSMRTTTPASAGLRGPPLLPYPCPLSVAALLPILSLAPTCAGGGPSPKPGQAWPGHDLSCRVKTRVLHAHLAACLSHGMAALCVKAQRGCSRRVLAARTALLGAGAAPLLVIGPQPLRRVLAAVHCLEPMAFCFVESSYTTASAWSQVTALSSQVLSPSAAPLEHCSLQCGSQQVSDSSASAGQWHLLESHAEHTSGEGADSMTES